MKRILFPYLAPPGRRVSGDFEGLHSQGIVGLQRALAPVRSTRYNSTGVQPDMPQVPGSLLSVMWYGHRKTLLKLRAFELRPLYKYTNVFSHFWDAQREQCFQHLPSTRLHTSTHVPSWTELLLRRRRLQLLQVGEACGNGLGNAACAWP